MDEKLSLEEMSKKDFYQFRKKYLESKILNNEALEEIEKIFDLNPEAGTVKIRCDEYHRHNYSCYEFDKPASGIVLRLLNEIRTYKGKLDRIKKEADYSND